MMSVCTIYAEGAPSLRFLQGPALSGAEGAGDDAADTTLVALHPGRVQFVPPFVNCAGRAPTMFLAPA